MPLIEKKLAEKAWPKPAYAPDHTPSQPVHLFGRIRLEASKKSLGPQFIDVELMGTEGVPGPGVAVFTFESQPTHQPGVDQMKRRQEVWEFVRNVRRRRSANA